jgi:hypothetical protein
MEQITSGSSLDPAKLPPTQDAIRFHSFRVHAQVLQWKLLDLRCINVEKWGWTFDGACLQPLKTDLEPAPKKLLQFIRCKCKMSSSNPCGTNSCSCRKNGLHCVAACGDCRGMDCSNKEHETVLQLEEDEDCERNIFDLLSEM